MVIGYGTVKKRDLTGSVSSLSGNVLKDIPVTTAAEAITGRMAGVFIFGPSAAWFEQCQTFCKKESYITAANIPEKARYGFIFNRCIISLTENRDSD